MTDLTKEIMAYSLQNAIEFGKAMPGKIMPKLFQHGLKKEDIKEIMPLINEAVKKVNSMSAPEQEKAFSEFKEYVKERVYEEKGLPELPGSAMKKKMVFRLAPFPSGALHIGNAKTYLLNSLYAEKYNGKIILVMDDTIGSEEKQPLKEGYELIEEAVNLLGIDYGKKIVYKSDRLKLYYKYAEKLIEKGKAYVDYSKPEEMREMRAKGIEIGDRKLPPDIQLLRWKEMFKMQPGHAVLRLKTDMNHPNPAFRDRVLFKIVDREHPRVGKKYRVWPTLEMSWAVDDHELGITHILRGNDLTMETEVERYIWDIFKWKHPSVTHTGLIRIEGLGAKVSKSKAQKEVKSGELFGWDDPRTWSVQSLIRRGITKDAIREFVKEIGLNRQDITVPIENLYSINRGIIDSKCNRYSFVMNPKKINLEKVLKIKEYDIPLHPDKTETRKVKIKDIFISEEDYKKYDGKEVRLLHLFNIKLGAKSKITSIENKKIPKINWVSDRIKIRVLMPNGKWVEGECDKDVEKLEKLEVIQFERFGFASYQGKSKGICEFWFAHP